MDFHCSCTEGGSPLHGLQVLHGMSSLSSRAACRTEPLTLCSAMPANLHSLKYITLHLAKCVFVASIPWNSFLSTHPNFFFYIYQIRHHFFRKPYLSLFRLVGVFCFLVACQETCSTIDQCLCPSKIHILKSQLPVL